MFILIICLLVGAVLAMGLNVVSLLPATLSMIIGILVWDLLQSGLSLSSLQSCVIATFALQIGYVSGIYARYLLTTPPPVATPVPLGKHKKHYAEIA
jgi:hypothetical protein